MSWISDSSSLVSPDWLSSLYEGHGILGSVMRSTTATGTNGPGILYNDWDSSADDTKEFRALILSGAPAGSVFNEDGSFTIPAGTADGTYTVAYRLYVDGADMGTANAVVTISAATTPVGSDLTTSYAVLNTVGANLPTSYAVAAAVGSSLSTSFQVLRAVGAALPTSYAVLNAVGSSLSTSYAVENNSGLTPVGSDLTTSFAVFNRVGSSLSTSYAIEESDQVPSNLIVEDGTGLPNAESYASAATADLYHSQRNHPEWAALTSPQKDAALRNATEWLDANFDGLWQGQRVKVTQALAWPRSGVVVDGIQIAYNALPVALVRSCCELALRAASTSLTQDVGAQVKSETVGPLSVVYADGARQQTKYAGVENLIGPLLRSSRNSIRLVRA